ncbi:hypothetical protein [Microbacterium sp. Leaf320]|uniref:hypothetical protein n=1 Tax=Microbacterium sp. Leaf320 TaxID=1736334 RepID=UPI0006FB757F|nr:hypothetical protein [Microbacterium sp. Leaf320]KQQ66109.1 hypothetical protein ASF63_12365 [Microbacterium sp. Leaf320]
MPKDKEWLDNLLKQADELEEQRVKTPIDVEVILAEELVTVRLTYQRRDDFERIASKHPIVNLTDTRGAWFNLDGVAKDYPDVVLIDGDGTDELYELRGKEAVYRWPDVYEALRETDRQSVQAAIWGVYVWEPQQALKNAKAKTLAREKEAADA